MDLVGLSYWSSWASLISLAVAAWNTYLILRIKAGIVLNVTLEPMLIRLKENSAELNRQLMYYEVNHHRFSEVAGICEADVKALRRRLGFIKSRFVRGPLRSMRTFRRDRSAANAQVVYASLLQVCQHVANMLEERRITG